MKKVTLIILALSIIIQRFLITAAIDGYYLYALILQLTYFACAISCFVLIASHWKEK